MKYGKWSNGKQMSTIKTSVNIELGNQEKLIKPQPPDVQFNLEEISLNEVTEVVHKFRTNSATGYSWTSCKVYKKCTKLLYVLWKLLNAAW